MRDYRVVPLRERRMKTYVYKVVLEPDELPSGEPAWHVYCPALYELGAATWGKSKGEALANIHEVLQMIVEELVEEGKPVPQEPAVEALNEPMMAVSV